MIFALMAMMFFAGSAVAANRAVQTLGSLKTNALRLGIAVCVGTVWALTFGHGAWGAGLHLMLISGALGFGVGDVGLFLALPLLGSRLTVLMTQCLAVPLAALTEWLWRGTVLTSAQTLASALILGGVALALAPNQSDEKAKSAVGNWTVAGVVFGLISAAGQGSGAVFSRAAFDVVKRSGQELDGLTASWQRASAGLIIALLSWWVLERVSARKLKSPQTALVEVAHEISEHENENVAASTCSVQPASHGTRWLFLHAALGPLLGVASLQTALKTTPSALVLSIAALTPLAVMPLAWWLEGDRPGARALLGAAVAVAGAALAVHAT